MPEPISFRELLIANAPRECWDDFEPILPAAPKPPELEDHAMWRFTSEQVKHAGGWRKDPQFDLADEGELEVFYNFEKAWKDFWEAMKKHRDNTKLQFIIQWPVFYADQVIKFIKQTEGESDRPGAGPK